MSATADQLAVGGVWRELVSSSKYARNLTDAEAAFLNDSRVLIHDRDPLLTDDFARTIWSEITTDLRKS